MNSLLSKIKERTLNESLIKAKESNHFLLYRTLLEEEEDTFVIGKYFGSNSQCELGYSDICLFLKLRSEMLGIKCVPWLTQDAEQEECSMCSLGVQEDMFHFLTCCPAYSDARKQYLGGYTISGYTLVRLLLSQCHLVIGYARRALSIRQPIT